MDGVLVREEHPIEGANRFLDILRESETPFLVLTNNSMYTRRDLSARLNFGGLNVPEDHIWTSALATAGSSRRSGQVVRRSSSAKSASPPPCTRSGTPSPRTTPTTS